MMVVFKGDIFLLLFSLIDRMDEVPLFFSILKKTLLGVVEIWTDVAVDRPVCLYTLADSVAAVIVFDVRLELVSALFREEDRYLIVFCFYGGFASLYNGVGQASVFS